MRAKENKGGYLMRKQRRRSKGRKMRRDWREAIKEVKREVIRGI